MLKTFPPSAPREVLTIEESFDLVVVGGGIAGCCTAVTAARLGLRVCLIQDRPVLGGNASSEVRLWVLGATCHMYSNNRWAREGGVIDELLVENLHRNRDGNPVIFDTVLLDLVISEPRITLHLNTCVLGVRMASGDRIQAVDAFCSQNSTRYLATAPLFVDASGDGILGFLSGAAFRVGAESSDEFGEGFAPTESFGDLLGHSIYFYSKDAGRPVRFDPPSYVLKDIEGKIPRYRAFNAHDSGCRLWWIEFGGRLDTVHDTERIKWELWSIALGVWNYVKNSGRFPEAENLTLEWLGYIPGKRESRRFEGDYLLCQQDIIEQREHPDAVAFGGWALDLHPADGVYSNLPGCTHEHSRGIYQIPYRCLYSRNIANLFLGGRTMSATHVAFGSCRVMATLGHCGQAIAHAAALCHENAGLLPRDIGRSPFLQKLQQSLLRSGQHIPGMHLEDPDDLVRSAALTASSECVLDEIPGDGPWHSLAEHSWGQWIPVTPGRLPAISACIAADAPCEITVECWLSHHPDYHTPWERIGVRTLCLPHAGDHPIRLDFELSIPEKRYILLAFRGGVPARIRASEWRATGLLSVRHGLDPSWSVQTSKPELGIIGFEKWFPVRRPNGHNLALRFDPPLRPYSVEQLRNGLQRPTRATNSWVAAPSDAAPTVTLEWTRPVSLRRLELSFDTDFDHPMESVLHGHPENDIPFCVRAYQILGEAEEVLFEKLDNYQTRNRVEFVPAIETRRLRLKILEMCGAAPAAVFEIRAYET